MVVSFLILFVCYFSVLVLLLVISFTFLLVVSVYFAPPFVFVCAYFGFIVSLFVDFVVNSQVTMR